MEVFLHVYLFLVGAVLGSFYNVVGLRVPKGMSIVKPRSHCPNCGNTLTWMELIPVISYIIQKGRCRNCKISFSARYPFFEFMTACLFTISPWMVGWSKELLVALVFISLLVIITVSDLETMLIPDKVLLFFLVLIVILRVVEPLSPWWDSLVGAGFGFVLFLLLAIVSKGGMGGGDIKLMGVIGLVLGFQGVLLTVFLSSFIGAVFGVVAIAMKKAKRKNPIPFGPFIAMGALISYFYHEEIFHWYINVFMHGGFVWGL
ncbi:prepilin peptidase [Salipaludibacillus keqinensis]|uniref:Prepilin leader peptidase/N-methyltransferase n=1 Tax=Salipaludibacillus keqinensis TaxID=2045207 RepID=A0A323TDY5_9BACI|nr:A24 family peptidase [Salipaludibacillus keqinensis]PYZ93632.1 prepilin peptidase [Salipaludibacillus keqinensis]